MAIFAIGDMHLSLGTDKPMDVFPGWEGYLPRLEANWRKLIGPDDTVILAGDTSWAMNLNDTKADFAFIQSLPCKKWLLKGNHDYWWKSSSKLEARYPGMRFLKNNFDRYADWHICGTRGWLCPNDVQFTEQDKRIYEREQVRLRLSLDAAMRDGAEKIILMMHFPPMNDKQEDSAFTALFREYPVKKVIYGHLHGAAQINQILCYWIWGFLIWMG